MAYTSLRTYFQNLNNLKKKELKYTNKLITQNTKHNGY